MDDIVVRYHSLVKHTSSGLLCDPSSKRGTSNAELSFLSPAALRRERRANASVTLEISSGQVALCLEDCVSLVTLLCKRKHQTRHKR
jgi:hypothetical protein